MVGQVVGLGRSGTLAPGGLVWSDSFAGHGSPTALCLTLHRHRLQHLQVTCLLLQRLLSIVKLHLLV